MSLITLGLAVTTNSTEDTNRVVLASRENFLIAIFGTGTFTCNIEVSLDGTNWDSLATKTADEIFTIAGAPYIRLVTSGMAGASVTVKADV
jgi:hypothetical protein